MFRMAYAQGERDAWAKFAFAFPSSEVAHHAMDLVGLGLIAAPVAHSLISGDENTSPGLEKVKHTSDLAGLGLLASSTAMKLLGKH